MILPGELRILSGTSIQTVVAQLDQRVRDSGDWHRDEDAERQIASRVGVPMCSFACSAKEDRHAANLWLAADRDGTVYVTNIVPRTVSSLSPAEYNAILEDFYHRFVEPLVAPGGFQAELVTGDRGLEEWLSPDTAKLLTRFSDLANRSTGTAHPSDKERWFAFVVAAHKERSTLDAGLLGEWFKQEGWPADTAIELSIQYEGERALLAFYDRHR